MTLSYLFLGDVHGDLDFLEQAALLAAEHDAELVQVGDFGIPWPKINSHTMQIEDRVGAQLTVLTTILQRAGEYCAKPPVQLRWLEGNHDWHTRLRELEEACSMACTTLPGGGGIQIAPNVMYQPRGTTYEDANGTRFLFFGGAPSIDQAMRTTGVSWWPEETASGEEFKRAMSVEGPIHVLVTHDAPDYPPGFEPKGSPEFRRRSARNMEMIRKLGDKFQPELNIHGHWHARYSSQRGNTKIIGLAHNYAKSFNDAVLLWSRGS